MKAVGLKEAAARVGLAYSTARKKVADGTFPIPELPRRGKDWHRYSTVDIERYLRLASTDDARRAS